MDAGFCKVFILYLLIESCDFFLEPVDLMNHINFSSNVQTAPNMWSEFHLIVIDSYFCTLLDLIL
jgi:hypothetical protein